MVYLNLFAEEIRYTVAITSLAIAEVPHCAIQNQVAEERKASLICREGTFSVAVFLREGFLAEGDLWITNRSLGEDVDAVNALRIVQTPLSLSVSVSGHSR